MEGMQMADEGQLMIEAFEIGIWFAAVYDCIRIFRRVWPHNRFFVNVEDILFWIYCAGSVFDFLYWKNNDAYRWFSVLGAGMGMFLYYKIGSERFICCGCLLLNWLSKPIKTLTSFLKMSTMTSRAKKNKTMKRTVIQRRKEAYGKKEKSCLSEKEPE